MNNSNVNQSTFSNPYFIEAVNYLERLNKAELYILNRTYIREKFKSHVTIQNALNEAAEEANNYVSFVSEDSHLTRAIGLSIILINKNPLVRAFMKKLLKPLHLDSIVPDFKSEYKVDVDDSNFNLISSNLALINDYLENTRIVCVFNGKNPSIKSKVGIINL